MPDRPTYNLHASLGYQLTLVARLQARRFEDSLRPLGLTRITWCVLLAIGNEGLSQPSDIAAFVGIDRSATSRALRHMQTAQMISRSEGTGDGRTRSVSLTDHGKGLLVRAIPLAQENSAKIEARLNPEERALMIKLLKKLHAGEDASLDRL